MRTVGCTPLGHKVTVEWTKRDGRWGNHVFVYNKGRVPQRIRHASNEAPGMVAQELVNGKRAYPEIDETNQERLGGRG